MPRVPRGARRALRTVLALLLTLALLAAATGVALLAYASVSLQRAEVASLDASAGGQMNILVVGSDSRDGLSPEQLQALGTDAVDGQRTDTIFLLSVRGGAAALLSFPRDLYVTRCDGSNGRINAAFANSVDCLVETVRQTSGIPVTHYMEVNLRGVVDVVDALGGVQVFLEQPMVDVAAGVNLPQGCVTLDGAQSVGFVRARSIDDDLGRIARQQRFLRQLAERAADPSTLLNPARLFAITGSVARSLTADAGFGLLDLARLARVARGLAGGGLATYTIPTEAQDIDGAAVLVPTGEAEALFASFRSGAILDVAPVPEGGLQPADVTVDVLNGSGIDGLAGQARDRLAGQGFVVGAVGNADPVPTTTVRHPPGQEAAAQLVASQFPGAVLELADTATLTVVVGPDAQGAIAAPAPAPAPAPAAPAPSAGAPAPALGTAPVPATC